MTAMVNTVLINPVLAKNSESVSYDQIGINGGSRRSICTNMRHFRLVFMPINYVFLEKTCNSPFQLGRSICLLTLVNNIIVNGVSFLQRVLSISRKNHFFQFGFVWTLIWIDRKHRHHQNKELLKAISLVHYTVTWASLVVIVIVAVTGCDKEPLPPEPGNRRTLWWWRVGFLIPFQLPISLAYNDNYYCTEAEPMGLIVKLGMGSLQVKEWLIIQGFSWPQLIPSQSVLVVGSRLFHSLEHLTCNQG